MNPGRVWIKESTEKSIIRKLVEWQRQFQIAAA